MQLTDQNFQKEIENITKPVLVDFFTSWCSPCSVLAPILEKLTDDYQGELILIKVNLDGIPLTAQKFGIERIPTVILFEKGKPVSGFTGLFPESIIKDWLEKNLKKENNNDDVEKIIKEYEDYARQKGIKLNPNKEVVERLVKGLINNEKKYGKKYCPCRRISGNPEEDQKNICPCFWHLEEIEKNGQCFCGLFMK